MLRPLPTIIEPEHWTLAFFRTSPHWWVQMVPGRYKHVSAFAWVPDLRLWLVYDITLGGTRLLLLPDSMEAQRRLADMTLGADLVRMPRQLRKSNAPPFAAFYCVPAIKHLIGLRCGALLATGLWRHCLANGGQPLHGAETSTTRSDDQSRDPPASRAGAAGQD